MVHTKAKKKNRHYYKDIERVFLEVDDYGEGDSAAVRRLFFCAYAIGT